MRLPTRRGETSSKVVLVVRVESGTRRVLLPGSGRIVWW